MNSIIEKRDKVVHFVKNIKSLKRLNFNSLLYLIKLPKYWAAFNQGVCKE